MKTESFTWVCANSKWRSLAVSIVLLVVVWLGFSSSAAQNAKPKRITSVQVSDNPQGARVTVVADLSLTDYEAFRRGDRFYLKLPGSDLVSGQPGFRGNGFDEVQAERSGDGVCNSVANSRQQADLRRDPVAA
jgi:hypothetical protein